MKVVFALLPVLMPACGLPDAQAGVRQDGSRPANFTKIDEDLYFGGEPGANEAFAFLARLGIRTVVSVDGARPRLAEAEKRGLRYVHIPLGYDGVTTSAGMQLAALARNSQGPWYVHCHHGRHRGPAAAAEIAAHIHGCHGPSGANRDYVLQLAASLRSLGIVDPHVFEVEAWVKAVEE